MRKTLILTTALVGIAGLVAAAQASQDRAPDSAQVTSQPESPGKDAKDIVAPRDERSHEARERNREGRREAHEEEYEDQD